MAIDRETITETVFAGTRTPADRLRLAGRRRLPGGRLRRRPAPTTPTRPRPAARGGRRLHAAPSRSRFNADGGHNEWVDAVCNQHHQRAGRRVPGQAVRRLRDPAGRRQRAATMTGPFRTGWQMDYPSIAELPRAALRDRRRRRTTATTPTRSSTRWSTRPTGGRRGRGDRPVPGGRGRSSPRTCRSSRCGSRRRSAGYSENVDRRPVRPVRRASTGPRDHRQQLRPRHDRPACRSGRPPGGRPIASPAPPGAVATPGLGRRRTDARPTPWTGPALRRGRVMGRYVAPPPAADDPGPHRGHVPDLSLVYALPGDPIAGLCGDRPLLPASSAQLREQFNLDDPLVVQYVKYIGGTCSPATSADLRRQPGHRPDPARRCPVTVKLAAVAILFEIVIGIVAGVLAGIRARRLRRQPRARLDDLVVISIPIFVLGFVAQFLFGVKLGWFSADRRHPERLVQTTSCPASCSRRCRWPTSPG